MVDSSVSVVIPVYNCERYIGEAIESVLAQTAAAAEILVADDGSTDGSAAAAATYPSVRVLRGEHAGISAVMNRGIRAARGELIAFLDADDLWAPEKLAKQIEAIERDASLSLVFALATNFLSPDVGEETRRRFDRQFEPVVGLLSGALLARRTAFDQVGLLRTDVRVGQFIDWVTRAEDLGLQRHVVPEVLLARRLHGGNVGVRLAEARIDFVRVAKSTLDRRRRR